MWQNAHEAYLQSRIDSAGPIELIRMLYQGAMASVREARRHLAAGDIAARARAINKAQAIIGELQASLDAERGGELSGRLEQLYLYMQRRLWEGNFRQADEPLADVLGLLCTLGEAWDSLSQAPSQSDAAADAWAHAAPSGELADVSVALSL